MNSSFGEIFLFLTDLAWKSRITIPILVTTAFLIMDIRLQIDINIQSGQAAVDLEHLEDSDSDTDIDDDDLSAEYTTDDSSSDDDSENSLYMMQRQRHDTV